MSAGADAELPLDGRFDALLRRTFDLAAQALSHGDPPYGSVLVDVDGATLAAERNTTVSDDDITAHPELKLARWAARQYDPGQAAQLTMVTSCQPCAMCSNAIARAHIGRVVYGLSATQLQALRPPGLMAPDAARVSYHGPHLASEATATLRTYFRPRG